MKNNQKNNNNQIGSGAKQARNEEAMRTFLSIDTLEPTLAFAALAMQWGYIDFSFSDF